MILDRYRHQSSSVTYLRVLLPAVAHFDEYASTRGIQSFTQYTDAVREDYQAYMEEFDNSYHEKYSDKYILFLVTVPRSIQNSLGG